MSIANALMTSALLAWITAPGTDVLSDVVFPPRQL